MQGKRILVVDDDPELLELMEHVLAPTQARVYTATSGEEALQQLYAVRPDLVILDVMMPDLDGWQVCRQIRQVSNAPVIMLSALGQDQDMIRGLDCGADDYVVKPVRYEVLLSRARAVLRRSVPDSNEKAFRGYDDGHLRVDLAQRRVELGGAVVKLTATEYRLLAYLVECADRVLTFRQILANVWGEEHRDRVQYVHVYASRLRRKLEPDPQGPQYLFSEHGVGYTFHRQIPNGNNGPR